MKGHAEEVIRLDVALIDCILWVVRLTLRTSLSVICLVFRWLLTNHFHMEVL